MVACEDSDYRERGNDGRRDRGSRSAGHHAARGREACISGGPQSGRISGAAEFAAADSQIAGLILLAGSTRPLEDMVIEQIADQYAQAGRSNTPESQQAIAKAQADKQAIEDPNLKPGVTLHLAGASIPSDYFLDLRNYDAVKVAAGLKIPILILQGERDYQVTMTDFNNWKRGLGENSNTVYKTYPALNHFFIAGSGPSTPQEYNTPGHVEADVVEDMANWIHTQLAKSASQH